jgi:hypothetical protein
MWLRRNHSRMRPLMGWPKAVAGVNSENSRLFSMARRKDGQRVVHNHAPLIDHQVDHDLVAGEGEGRQALHGGLGVQHRWHVIRAGTPAERVGGDEDAEQNDGRDKAAGKRQRIGAHQSVQAELEGVDQQVAGPGAPPG